MSLGAGGLDTTMTLRARVIYRCLTPTEYRRGWLAGTSTLQFRFIAHCSYFAVSLESILSQHRLTCFHKYPRINVMI